MLSLLFRTATRSGLRVAAIEQTLVLAVFGCVVLHEIGHAITAIRCGVPIVGITLYPFGGVARMGRRPPSGGVEVRIALAGPAVNVVVAGLILAAAGGRVLAPGPSTGLRMLGLLFWANVMLAGFNLIPAFPLDGGRVVRGVLASRLGWARATVLAASAGQVVSVVLIVAGLLHGFWIAVAGLILLPGANAELRLALALRQLENRRAGDVARTALITVDSGSTVSAAAELSGSDPRADFLITDGGKPAAFLSAARLWSTVRTDPPGTMTVGAIGEPLGQRVHPTASLEQAIEALGAAGGDVAAVIDDECRTVGVVTRGDLERAVQLQRRFTDQR